MKLSKFTAVLLAWMSLAIGCQVDSSGTSGDEAPDEAKTPAGAVTETKASPGKPSAPVDISYEVMGNPVVGVPVSVNVVITSEHKPLSVKFSIDDNSALSFQSGQVEKLEIPDAAAGSLQQLTVVPQREGRVYVNVSAEVPSDLGTMIRSIAIPIKVGGAPKKTTVNGELKEGPDGEKVISMPAEESQ